MAQGPTSRLDVLQEYLKQITTLSTWSILLGVGLAEKIFPTSSEREWLLYAIIAFIVSIATSLSIQIVILFSKTDRWQRVSGVLSLLCFLAFLSGLALVVRSVWETLSASGS